MTRNRSTSFSGADIRNILDFQEDFPDARVVKLEQNYRSTETILSAANAVIANNRGGIAKRLWSELGPGRADPAARARGRARRGALRRRRDRAAGRRGRLACGDRRAVRTNAMSRVIEDTLVRREIGLPGDRRHEVLRTRGDQGCGRLPVAARQPVRRGQLHARGQLAAARHRADLCLTGARPRDGARHLGVGGGRAPEQVPGLGAAAVKALRRFMDTMEELRVLAGMPRRGSRSHRNG